MSKILTVSIIGCGSRGAQTYGQKMFDNSELYKVVSLCDIKQEALDIFSKKWGIDEANCFIDPQEFFKQKRSDVLVLATQDRDHVWMCKRALELGYDVLLEKPISPAKDELYELLDAHKKYGGNVLVCHVLRYAPAYIKIKEILDSKILGDLRVIESAEQVGYWHQAHSFVRGNWSRDDETSPMIMQKCCHDMDILQYFVGAKCKTVYSIGNLSYFNKEHQPEGAADRCADCKYIKTCPYSAEVCYVDLWIKFGKHPDDWPMNVVCSESPLTEEGIRKAYQASEKYGRCVYKCNNNVVDNQLVALTFENGVKCTHTMTAFTEQLGRRMNIHCTLGEIKFDEPENLLKVISFGKEPIEYKLDDLVKQFMRDSFGHGGGDEAIIKSLYENITMGGDAQTTLENSVESHLMAIAAEESRVLGVPVEVHKK